MGTTVRLIYEGGPSQPVSRFVVPSVVIGDGATLRMWADVGCRVEYDGKSLSFRPHNPSPLRVLVEELADESCTREGWRYIVVKEGVHTWHKDLPKVVPTSPVGPSSASTRHLLYHLYPKRGGRWKERVDTLFANLHKFNGSRTVAVVYDSTTEECEAVNAFDGRGFEIVVMPNDPDLREVATFETLFTRLERATGLGDVALYAHAKGVTKDVPTVERWVAETHRIYFDVTKVDEVLRHYPLAGAFRRRGPCWPESTSRWHYSGSWFWFRCRDLFAKPDWRRIDRFWTGIEPYPSLHFKFDEAGLLAYDLGYVGPSNDLYLEEAWRVIDRRAGGRG